MKQCGSRKERVGGWSVKEVGDAVVGHVEPVGDVDLRDAFPECAAVFVAISIEVNDVWSWL